MTTLDLFQIGFLMVVVIVAISGMMIVLFKNKK